MGIRAVINSSTSTRISINNQQRQTVRSVISPINAGGSATKLTDLTDVQTVQLVDNATVVYDSIDQNFKIKPLPSIEGGTF